MTQRAWLQKLNRQLARDGKRVVRTRVNDPRWTRLGDYYLEDTKTGRAALAFVSLRQIGPAEIRREIDWRRAMRERRERRKTQKSQKVVF